MRMPLIFREKGQNLPLLKQTRPQIAGLPALSKLKAKKLFLKCRHFPNHADADRPVLGDRLVHNENRATKTASVVFPVLFRASGGRDPVHQSVRIEPAADRPR
jgi:hypothetical protein